MTMNQRKVSLKYHSLLYLLIFALTAITVKVTAHSQNRHRFYNTLTAFTDTVPAQSAKKNPDSTLLKVKQIADTLPVKNDSALLFQRVDTMNIKMSADSMDAPVNYKAQDSMVLEVDTKRILLYGKTEVKYTDVTLSAPTLVFDQADQVVTARMGRDSAGTVLGLAKLIQDQTTTVSDSIRFNFKTQKGLTYSSFFQQDEIYNFAEKVKKIDAQTFYAARGRFTTCNLDTPHFAFRFGKAKFVSKKVAVTGPVHPEFEGVPVPIWLPFGIFPLASGRHSGFIPPQFTVTENFGVGLEGLGYYKVFSDYLDAKLWGDIYSYGSWRVNLAPSYRKRYRYTGGFNISLQNTKFNFKSDPDFTQTKTFFVTWNHSMDSKARPGVTFNASVNAGSSKFLSLVPNGALVNPGTPGGVSGGSNYIQPINFTNQLSSSISFQKSWQGKPYNLSVNLNHNQNTNTRLVNLNLPDVAFIVNTVYPFQQKEMAGEGKWYEKLGIGYNGNVRGQVSFFDTAFQFKQLIDTFQWGAVHDIPITLSLPPVGPLQFAPNITYRERWYAQKFFRTWNDQTQKLDTTVQKGFHSARETSIGVSLNTAFFGKYQARNKEANIQAIRHIVRPTIAFSYKPDLMEPYYYREQVDTAGNEVLFSVFDGSIFGPFAPGKSGGINFGIDNNLEMKVRSKDDTTTNDGLKIVKLIDGFGISGGYNFLADSFKLSTFNLYARSFLFEKISITANALLDPYKRDDSTGRPINQYAWEGGGRSLGSIVTGSINVSTTLQSKKSDADKKSNDEIIKENGDNMSQDQMMQQLDYVRRNPAEFTDFNIPWSVSIGANLSFAKVLQPNFTYKNEVSSSFNFTGDFNISPKWKVGATGFYDLKNFKMQSLTTFISRDLHCWQMSINITPVGLFRSFNISINPKSGLLRDLRINRTRYFYTN
jgi:LPS-assembly protein